MKLSFKKICIVVLVIALLMPSFASVTFAAYEQDVDVTNKNLYGSVSITGLEKGATVKWQHVMVPSSFVLTEEGSKKNFSAGRENTETGWIFYPNYEQYSTDSKKMSNSPLMCFADAYGISLKDAKYSQYNIGNIEKYSGLNDLQKEGIKQFEQDVIQAFIDDYSGRLSSTDGSTPSATIHGSSEFQQALKNLVTRGVLTASKTDSNNVGFVAIRSNLSAMRVDTGMYVMLPESDMTNGILYSPTAAFVNFRYAEGTGEDLSGDVEGIENVVAHAKSTKLGVDKMVASGDHSYTVGDIVEFNIKSTYPTLAPEMYASSVFKFEDRSCEVTVESKKDVVVKIGNTVLVEGKDYVLEVGGSYTQDGHAAGTKMVVTLMDGDSTNGVADYNPDFAGKEIIISYKAKVVTMWKWNNTSNFYEIWNEAKVLFDSYSSADMIKTYPVSFKLQKIDTNSSKALTGAVFVARKLSDPEGTYIKIKYDDGIYKVDGVTTNINEAKITINNTAGDIIAGLDGDETYVFSEIQAPVGYSLSNSKIYVGVTKPTYATANDVFIQLVKDETYFNHDKGTKNGQRLLYKVEDKTSVTVFKFANTSLMALPSTGGWGTYAFTIAGVAAIATAVIIIRNKKDKELDESET